MELNKAIIQKITGTFREITGNASPHMLFSPGRINLLGEHIDYNDGWVLPAAVSMGIYGAFAPCEGDDIIVTATDFNDTVRIPANAPAPVKGWGNYVASVVNQFVQKGISLPGCRLVIGSDLPIGSGLSSSAALEGAVSFALNTLSGAGLTPAQLALLGQAAEHDYPGVKCGIMDQFANMLGKEGHIVRIDCMTQATDYLPLQLHNYQLVLLYSNVQHALTGGEYNERRLQCTEGLSIIRSVTGKNSFRQVTAEDLETARGQMPEIVYNRCRYVVEEIQRTRLAAEALQQGNMQELGKLMYETHEGLRTLYEVSLPELDGLVAFAKSFPGALGARLMGGGFGGCTLNLVEKGKAQDFTQQALADYTSRFGIEAKAYPVEACNGTCII